MAWQKEKLDWNKDDYFNPEELNKIENNTIEVVGLIKQLMGADIELESPITDRDYTTIEFADGYNRVEGNIKKVSDAFPMAGMIEPKTTWQAGDGISYRDLIRMETNITLLYNLLKPNADAMLYCGEFICGEE